MAYLIGTAGHVDHGKTTLIAALTGIDADRLPEEKARGMTIDLGFAYVDLEGIGRVSIVDVPGHERFIKNMLAGASGVDVAMLCVAADEGVMPQTREHFEILRLLEARSMVVALTKCDLADEDTQSLAELDVRELLDKTPYAEAPIIRLSAHTGQGMDDLKQALAKAIQSLGEREFEERNWFLPIDRVFTIAGHGTVITGTLARGRLKAGAEGVLMPGDERVRIRSVQTHGEAAEHAEAGQRTAVNVAGVKKEVLHRGQAIGAPGALVETTCINVRLQPVGEIKHGMRVRTHIGAGEFIGKLFLFDNAPGYGQVRLEEPVACARQQRLVLRRYSPPDVVAGAEIVTPNAKPRRKNDKDVAELFSEKTESGLDDLVAAELTKRPNGAETAAICEALGRTPQELGEAFEKLKSEGRALGFAGVWVASERYPEVAEKVREAAMKLHRESPQASAVPKTRVTALTGLDWNPKALDRLLARMDEDGLIAVVGGDVRHPDYTLDISDKQAALLERVVEAMRKAGAIALHPKDLAADVGAPVQAIEEMLRLGQEVGRIVRVDEGLWYAAETLSELKETVRSLAPKFTIAQFRDATGSSRKFALPLLQYFDEQRVTRRVGEERAVIG